MKFCKRCGFPLGESKKCEGCGRRYFFWSKRTTKIVAISLLILSLIYGAGEMESEMSNLRATVTGQNILIEQLASDNASLISEVESLSKNVVYITPTGSKYHSKNCSHIDAASKYLILNKELAQALEYYPCSKCIGGNPIMPKPLHPVVKTRLMDEKADVWHWVGKPKGKPTLEEIYASPRPSQK